MTTKLLMMNIMTDVYDGWGKVGVMLPMIECIDDDNPQCMLRERESISRDEVTAQCCVIHCEFESL